VRSVTDLHDVAGPFDLVVDNGCLHSLPRNQARDAYVQTLLRLTRPGSRYFLRLFIRERPGFFSWIPSLSRDEVERRFGDAFAVEAHESGPGEAPFGMADATELYWMRRVEV
jgi:SAM-dependent methyltransferase